MASDRVTFKLGDVVQLKSGGPTMTVRNIRDHYYGGTLIGVSWFPSLVIGSWGMPEHAEFIEAALNLVRS